MLPEFGGKQRTECFNIMFPGSLCAGQRESTKKLTNYLPNTRTAFILLLFKKFKYDVNKIYYKRLIHINI